jgi:hypothetical protein
MRQVASVNISQTASNTSDDGGSDSDSGPEVTLNILERQPRVTAGMFAFQSASIYSLGRRMQDLSREDAEIDNVFWGSDKHRTWEESSSDSEVSYDIEDDEENSDSDDSELDEDEEDEEDEEEPESEDEVRISRKSKGYSDPRLKSSLPKKRENIQAPRVPKPPLDSYDVPETRHTTRERTQEVNLRSIPSTPQAALRTRALRREPQLTQEQLMAEAAITEEWNKADLEAYVRYTELSDKDKAELEKGKQGFGVSSRSEYRIISRSFSSALGSTSEIRIHSPTREKQSKVPRSADTARLMGIAYPQQSCRSSRGSSRYRHPVSLEGFSCLDEFARIEDRLQNEEVKRVRRLLNDLSALL